MEKELTQEELTILKKEKRMGNSLGFFIWGISIVFALVYILLFYKDYGATTGIVIFSILIFFAVIVPILVNLSINKDIKSNIKTMMVRPVEEKFIEASFEAGSGNLYIPGLGDMFPKLWGQKMRETKKYTLKTKYLNHEVTQSFYDSVHVGEEIMIHYAANSGTIIGFSKPGDDNSYYLKK
jgi:hypothetical protein